uniref:thiol oxidase n=1 Tax=viral metagenome TaxID=1070528 RepID=A0A6C0I0P5_9ZZZZ
MPEFIQEENMIFNPSVWGPCYWFFLMTLALSYPEQVNAVTKRKYYDFINNLPIFIPNPKIANQFSHLLDLYPVSPYLDNKESFIKWVHFIHNKINVMIGKDEISYAEAMDNYFAEYRPKPIYLSDKIKWKKHFIIAFFILLCLFFIYLYWE